MQNTNILEQRYGNKSDTVFLKMATDYYKNKVHKTNYCIAVHLTPMSMMRRYTFGK